MTEVFRDRLLGVVLIAVSIAWLAAAKYSVPEGYSGSFFGPRAFPEALGIMLLVLALILLARTFVKRPADIEDGEEEEASQTSIREEVWSSAVTFGFLIAYFVALPILGFVISTTVMIAGFLWFVLRKRSVFLLAGMSLGFSFGLWLLMGRLLGVYLPTGMFSWGF